jgi:hypothetical protein
MWSGMTGRFGDAWEQAERAFEFGTEIGEPDATVVYEHQWMFLSHTLSTPPETFTASSQFMSQPDTSRLAKAISLLDRGDLNGLRQTLGPQLNEELRDVPPLRRLQRGLLYAEMNAALGQLDRCRRLYGDLLPYAGTVNVQAACVASLGPVSFYLGVLARALGMVSEAAAHFEEAMTCAERLGIAPWAVRSRLELGQVALQRGLHEQASRLLVEAQAEAERLGMNVVSHRAAAALKEVGASPAVLAMRKEGDFWAVSFAGKTVRMRDAKGYRCLALLLARPGQEWDVIALESAAARRTEAEGTWVPTLAKGGDEGAAILDAEAKAAYRLRLNELVEELDEARAWNDAGREARVREEIGVLERELSVAVGFGGRDRRLGSPTEKARVRVTLAVRSALRRIREEFPELAEHLEERVRTGRVCVYLSDGGS